MQKGAIAQTQEQAILDEMTKLRSEYNHASSKGGMTIAQRNNSFTKE